MHKRDAIRRQVFGARLLDPNHGDVIIRFPETIQTNLEEKVLFAESEILCAFSPYFKNCNTHLLLPILLSCFCVRFFIGKLTSVLYGDLQVEGQLQSLQYQLSYDVDINVPALRVCPPNRPTNRSRCFRMLF